MYIDYINMEWCYGFWLDDFIFVMIGFDQGVKKVGYFNFIRFYMDWYFGVFGCCYFGFYGVGVFGVEIEDVVDFDVLCGYFVVFCQGFKCSFVMYFICCCVWCCL